MKHRTIQDVNDFARVYPEETPEEAYSVREMRRTRLERLADLIERHNGTIQLLSRVEYAPESERRVLRADHSPLTIAYEDGAFRAEGLAGDRLEDVERFFDLTPRQSHHLLCDCHYGMTVTPEVVAYRVREIARRPTLGELWRRFRDRVAALLQR